jgi:hypothetical protein
MSLTSYRAAPPRVKRLGSVGTITTALIKRKFSVLGRPGDDLLSHVLRQSTIGAKAFDGRVRDGIGSYHLAKATRPAKNGEAKLVFLFDRLKLSHFSRSISRLGDESNQVERAISTGKLHALRRFYIRPIDVVVFHGSSGRTCFEAGFPLRCLQRLSIPYIATLHCGWRHNRSTRDTFTPVLSY